MGVLLFLLALAMIATGGAAMVFGAPIIQVERGWAMVIAGSIGATGGVVLLGVAVCAQRLSRTAREVIALRHSLPELVAVTPAIEAGHGALAPAAPSPVLRPAVFPPGTVSPPPHATAAPGAPEGAGVVGQYQSAGNSYVMYSDGSIQADTQSGQHRFQSLDELRSFIAAGGERS